EPAAVQPARLPAAANAVAYALRPRTHTLRQRRADAAIARRAGRRTAAPAARHRAAEPAVDPVRPAGVAGAGVEPAAAHSSAFPVGAASAAMLLSRPVQGIAAEAA